MKRIVLLFCCLLAMPISINAAELYRWVDKSGKVHYGNAPATEAMQAERKKFYSPPAQEGEELPYETRLAQQNFPVTLYTASNCIELCQEARDFLNQRGIPFAEKALITQEEIDNFKQQSSSDESPTLAVGKTYLKGFQAEQWDSDLDIAGYPQIAPYLAPKEPPAAASQVAPANPAAQ